MILGSGAGFKRYSIDGKEMSNIIFYNDGKIVAETNQGWIDSTIASYSYKQGVESIDEITDVVRATKENLNKTCCYYRKVAINEYSRKPEYALYIYTGIFSKFTPMVERECYRNYGKISYANFFGFTFNADGEELSIEVRSAKNTKSEYDQTGLRALEIEKLVKDLNRHTGFSYADAVDLLESENSRKKLIKLLS